MAHIFREGHINVHIEPGNFEPAAHCYDERDETFRTVVEIDLLAFLPIGYGEDEDNQVPSWQFAIQAIQVCAARGDELWEAWHNLKHELS